MGQVALTVQEVVQELESKAILTFPVEHKFTKPQQKCMNEKWMIIGGPLGKLVQIAKTQETIIKELRDALEAQPKTD